MSARARTQAAPAPPAAPPPWLADLAASLPLMMTFAEVLAVLRCSDRKLRRMVAAGEIHAMRSASTGAARLIFPRSEPIRWLSEHAAR